ncbi:hypothetical protein FHU38_000287 [Saccharomonospora amisosensis]|uniref:MT0933-like antitoxin protein n=2 Tax=Saccharomonospora amisosensis TaxID=1128677 RepID=A0A7X5ULP1_9PSEU|nr:hypothetical protein [Saccharomonospora amisosensis]
MLSTLRHRANAGGLESMGFNFDQIKHRAKDALGKNSGKIEQGIDKASGLARSRFGKQAGKIDSASRKAKEMLRKNAGGGQQGGDQQGGPR